MLVAPGFKEKTKKTQVVSSGRSRVSLNSMEMKTGYKALCMLLMCLVGASLGKPCSKFNGEQTAGLFEGDILLPKGKTIEDVRNGLSDPKSRWPGGVLPFTIAPGFTEEDLSMILRGFNEYEAKTCIRFVPWTDQEDYITITNDGEGCSSSVGRDGGPQRVNLESGKCTEELGTVLHEFCHALGFFHEQSRWDRDKYVEIHYKNIDPKKVSFFETIPKSVANGYGESYDYRSMMHYPPFAFSINELATITPKDPLAIIGQRDGFSDVDIRKIKAMYCQSI